MATDLRVIETNLCYWRMRTKCFDFLGAILQIRETEQKVHLWVKFWANAKDILRGKCTITDKLV